ncbi:MAG: Dihydrolipoyl dehydrogenase [Candidatus Marinimicrobia bacterium]|nr:Dihydrolipoyl dehydrogenase [Candidatus Neomarinimicrobiota bacterium]
MSDNSYSVDVAVLGGGPGGYVAAIRAAQLGHSVAVVEREDLGGICVKWGCIPTKALLRSAELYETFQNAEEYGLTVKEVGYDFKKVIQRSRRVSKKQIKGVENLFKKNNIEYIKGSGKFTDAHTLEVDLTEGDEKATVEAEHIIVATGARPGQIPGVEIDGEKVISSKEAMNLDEQPESLIVMGAGAIGVEFAYFYNAFGTEVTVVEMMDSLVPVEDEEISNELGKAFKKAGIDVKISTKVESVKTTKNGVEVTVSKDGEEETLKADKALMAMGVQGNVENIGLKDLGVEIEKGHIVADEYYKTNVDGVYAIGDVIGPPWLAHVASKEGVICVEGFSGKNPVTLDYDLIPGCTYCQPQIASIGLTEQEAKDQGYDVKVGKYQFRPNGKAVASGETEGFVKMVIDNKYGEILGTHIIGAEATELIAEVGVAKSLEATWKELHNTVHAHPTLSEVIEEATGAAFDEAIHL